MKRLQNVSVKERDSQGFDIMLKFGEGFAMGFSLDRDSGMNAIASRLHRAASVIESSQFAKEE